MQKESGKFNVVFQFDTAEQALVFAEWYENGGEQSFDGGDQKVLTGALVDMDKLSVVNGCCVFELNEDNEVIVPLEIITR